MKFIPKTIVLLFILTTAHVFGQTDISGPIINGDTWNAAGSPYRVTDNLEIQALTIEPGVTVAFTGAYEFRITGSFIAIGTRTDSIFFQNDADFSGNWGGIIIENTSTIDTLIYARVSDASPAGIKVRNNTAHLEHCNITENSGNGLSISGGVLQIFRTEIYNNSQHGIAIDSNGSVSFKAARIIANGDKGLFLSNGKSVLQNTIISRNNQGGIILNTVQDTLIFDNTVIADHGSEFGVFAFNGTVIGRNSIIYFNDTSVGNVAATLDISYCNADPSIPGTGNLSSDPFFVDLDNFVLASGSVCIDRGIIDSDYNDICFPPSLGGVRNDIGAYGGPGACEWYDQLFVWPDSIDFGKVTITIPADTFLVVKNYRNTPLYITDIDLSGSDSGYFFMDTSSFMVNAFDSQTVHINFVPSERRSYSANLEVNGYHDTVIIPLSGTGEIPNIDVNPTDLQFGIVDIGDSTIKEINISNLAAGDLYISNLIFSKDSYFAADTIPLKIPFGQTEKLSVVFKPDTLGSISGLLSIVNNDPDENPVIISLAGVGSAGVITTEKDTLDYANISVGNFSDLDLIFSNSGNDTLKIYSRQLESGSTYFSIVDTSAQTSFSPGSEPDTITVRFQPLDAGDFSAELIILSNDPFRDSLFIPISGRGVKPEFNITPADSVKFDEVIVGREELHDVIIKNYGSADLKIFEYVLGNMSPGDTSFTIQNYPSDSIIVPQDSVTFQILFMPKAENRYYTAELKIPTNDIDHDTVSLNLAGKSVLPVLAGAEPLDFGRVVIQEVASKTFKLWNSGTGTLIIDSIYVTGGDSSDFSLSEFAYPYSLEEETDTLKSAILFSPSHKGNQNTQVHIITNIPGSAGLDSFMVSGIGLKPELTISKDLVSFEKTYIRDSETDTVYISNSGNGKLNINSIMFAADSDTGDFSISGPGGALNFPISIDSAATEAILVTFTPDSILKSDRAATLLIYSNDPDRYPVPDTIQIHGIAESPVIISVTESFAFDSTFVDQDRTQYIRIENLGVRELKIHIVEFDNDASPFQADIGSGLVIDSISMDSLAITFEPQKAGSVNDMLRLISNDPINDTISVSVSGIGKTDPSPAEIDIAEFPDSLLSGSEYTVQIDLSGNQAPITWCILLARPGARAEYDTLTMSRVAGSESLWRTDLPGYLITERGLEYYIDVRHGGRNSFWPDENAADHPQYVPVHILSLKYPESTRVNFYQMLSLPVESNGRTLTDLFGDTLGTYNDTEYRMFEYDPETEYHELSDMDKTLPRGKAIWLITRDSKRLAVENVKSPPDLDTVSISLKKGWNVIGNPFAFPVSVGDLDLSVVHPNLLFYGNQGWDEVPVSLLMPFEGYAVYTQDSTVLRIPPTEANLALTKTDIKHIAAPEWKFNISAVRGPYHDKYNIAGLHQNAENGFDRVDVPEPPFPGNFVSVFFHNPATPLTADFRASSDTASGYRFEFSVVSNFAGTSVISFDESSLPSGYRYTIVTDETGVRYDDPRTIDITANQQDFILFIGEAQFIEKAAQDYQVLPVSYALHQNYPNPFNPATSIKYTLPAPGKVDLVIYDILGKMVRKLQSGIFKEAGYHTVVWDGTNEHQQSVASGIYFLTLRTPAYQHTVKMLLQR